MAELFASGNCRVTQGKQVRLPGNQVVTKYSTTFLLDSDLSSLSDEGQILITGPHKVLEDESSLTLLAKLCILDDVLTLEAKTENVRPLVPQDTVIMEHTALFCTFSGVIQDYKWRDIGQDASGEAMVESGWVISPLSGTEILAVFNCKKSEGRDLLKRFARGATIQIVGKLWGATDQYMTVYTSYSNSITLTTQNTPDIKNRAAPVTAPVGMKAVVKRVQPHPNAAATSAVSTKPAPAWPSPVLEAPSGSSAVALFGNPAQRASQRTSVQPGASASRKRTHPTSPSGPASSDEKRIKLEANEDSRSLLASFNAHIRTGIQNKGKARDDGGDEDDDSGTRVYAEVEGGAEDWS